MDVVMPAMKDRIWARIEDLGPGKAFMAKEFPDIASRGSIDVALASLTSAGKILRIRRGLCDLPIRSHSVRSSESKEPGSTPPLARAPSGRQTPTPHRPAHPTIRRDLHGNAANRRRCMVKSDAGQRNDSDPAGDVLRTCRMPDQELVHQGHSALCKLQKCRR